MNKPAITVTLVHTKDTKNYRVFAELPASADAKPMLGSPLYIPSGTPGIMEAVAIEVTVAISATATANAAPAEPQKPTPASTKREKSTAATK